MTTQAEAVRASTLSPPDRDEAARMEQPHAWLATIVRS